MNILFCLHQVQARAKWICGVQIRIGAAGGRSWLKGGINTASGVLVILCFLIWVLVTWMCSLPKDPLTCILMICMLFCIQIILKIELDGIIHRSLNQPHRTWKYEARGDKGARYHHEPLCLMEGTPLLPLSTLAPPHPPAAWHMTGRQCQSVC